MNASLLKRRENLVWKLMLAPTIIVLVLFTIFPTLFTFYNSLHSWNLASPQFGTQFVGLNNFISMLSDPRFYNALYNSLRISFLSIFIEFVLGFFIAWLLATGFRGSKIIRAGMLLPTMITPVVASFMWLLIFNSNYGILRHLFEAVGVIPAPLMLADSRFAWLSIVITNAWQWTPFVALLLLAGMVSVPVDILEASSIDGANKFKQTINITLPYMKSVILIALLVRLMDSFRLFEPIFILTRGGPGTETETLTYLIFRQGFAFFEMGYASTLALLLLVVITFFSQILIKIVKDDWEV